MQQQGAETPLGARGDLAMLFRNRAVDSYVDAAAALHPTKTAIVDRFGRYSWPEIADLSRRLAAGMEARGITAGDRVAVQLPNWHHFPVIEYALSRLGAICVPLPHIYRQRELAFMLALTAPVMAIVPDEFRGFSFSSMMRELRPGIPNLRDIVVVGGQCPPDCMAYDTLLSTPPFQGDSRTDPNGLTEIVFTSGTTGEPKGVMHSANTNLAPLINLIPAQSLNEAEVILMASTFGHQTGFVYGGQLPAVLGATLVLMDQWEPKAAARLIADEGVTWSMGATPFLQDIIEHGAAELSSLRTFLCSGAPIPATLLARARQCMGAQIASGWGMTEVGLVTLSRPTDSDARIIDTDGCALPGMTVRVLDEDGETAAPGQEGDLVCRGPSMFLGYYLREEFTKGGFIDERWFRTGDRARMDEAGYIRIVGRSKDIIIRGGQNIPVVEVEDLLVKHPAIVCAAVVALPDPRLQERACAVVTLRPGTSFTFAEMQAHLQDCRLARQYIPEHLVIADALPMTPSGKVQKFVLRKQVLNLAGAGLDDVRDSDLNADRRAGRPEPSGSVIVPAHPTGLRIMR